MCDIHALIYLAVDMVKFSHIIVLITNISNGKLRGSFQQQHILWHLSNVHTFTAPIHTVYSCVAFHFINSFISPKVYISTQSA